MQSSPGLRTCFNSSPRAADHSFGSKGSDWTTSIRLLGDPPHLLPLLRSERLPMVQSAHNENMLEMLWWGGLTGVCMHVCASGCSCSRRCVCVCVCSLSSFVDPLFPRKLTWLGKQKLHSYWPTSHWCINLIGWRVLLPHTCCKECALWVQLERNGNILWSLFV